MGGAWRSLLVGDGAEPCTRQLKSEGFVAEKTKIVVGEGGGKRGAKRMMHNKTCHDRQFKSHATQNQPAAHKLPQTSSVEYINH